ncbi:MAG: hypothetical protein M3Y37_01580, partial [Chloroflexota bacterium]|nr:hypothetical protein [Chloroflexota bacterium]
GRTGVAARSRLRVEERENARREAVRRALANALDTNDGETLADLALSGDLDDIDDLNEASTRQVVAALAVRHLERALASNDDTLILEAYDESIMATAGVLTAAQRNRIDLAFDRQRWLSDVREALKRKDRGRIDRLYAEMPEAADSRLSEREVIRIQRLREQDEAVRQLEKAASRDDGAQLVAALQRVEKAGAWIPESVNWTDVSRTVDRYTLTDAIRRAAHQTPRDYGRLARLLPQLRDACGGAYPPDAGLDFARLDWEVRQIAQIARVREALASEDDRAIVAAALPDIYGVVQSLERGEQARIERAVAVVNRALRRSGQRTPSTSASSSTVETV